MFVPWIAPVVKSIRDGEGKNEGEAARELGNWLRIHRVRSLGVDLPGWLCFLCGVLSVVRL